MQEATRTMGKLLLVVQLVYSDGINPGMRCCIIIHVHVHVAI